MNTFREKVRGFIDALKRRKILSLFIIGVLVAAIPATIILEQQNQDNRQHAAGEIQLATPLNAQASSTMQISWTYNAPTAPTPTPTTIPGYPTFYASPNPCVLNESGVCSTTLSWNDASGKNTTNAPIVIRKRRTGIPPSNGDDPQKVGTVGVAAESVTISSITAAGASFDMYYGWDSVTRAYPVSVYGVKPYTLGLVDNAGTLVGQKTYIDCRPIGSENPPNDSVLAATGSCSFPMPGQIAAGTYRLVMYAPSGAIVATGSPITVQGSTGTNTFTGTFTATPNPCILNAQGRCNTTITWNASGLPNVTVHVVEANIDVSTQPSGTISNLDWVTAQTLTFQLKSGNNVVATLSVKGIAQNTITASSPYCVVNAEGRCGVSIFWSSDQPNITVKVRTIKDPTETPITGGNNTPTGSGPADYITEQGDIFNMYSGSNPIPISTFTVVGIKQNSIGVSSPFCIINTANTCTLTVFWSSDQPNVNVRVKLPNDPTETPMTDLNVSSPTGVAFPNYITTQGDIFELYSGNTLLNTVSAVGLAQNSITAIPNPCIIPENSDRCTSTLIWSTVNKNGLVIKVRASTYAPAAATDTPVTGVGLPATGTNPVDWVTGANPTFDLYSSDSSTTPFSSVTVQGLALNRVTAPTTTCKVADSSSMCSIPVSWSSQNAQNVSLQVRQTDDPSNTWSVIAPNTPTGKDVPMPFITINGATFQLFSGTTPIGQPLQVRAVIDPNVTPSTTITPGPTTTITPTPTESSSLKFTVTTSLTGINKSSQPKHPNRDALVYIFNNSNALVGTKLGTITYSAANGNFTGSIDKQPVGSAAVTAGNYILKLATPQFLRKNVPGITAISPNTTITLPSVTLTTGDVNGDNKIDILDYNIIKTCYGSKMSSTACLATPQYALNGVPAAPVAPLADLNDDGVVDLTDYNLFIISIATQNGD